MRRNSLLRLRSVFLVFVFSNFFASVAFSVWWPFSKKPKTAPVDVAQPLILKPGQPSDEPHGFELIEDDLESALPGVSLAGVGAPAPVAGVEPLAGVEAESAAGGGDLPLTEFLSGGAAAVAPPAGLSEPGASVEALSGYSAQPAPEGCPLSSPSLCNAPGGVVVGHFPPPALFLAAAAGSGAPVFGSASVRYAGCAAAPSTAAGSTRPVALCSYMKSLVISWARGICNLFGFFLGRSRLR
ncbi:MAG: hypothetical protein KA436_00210 [Oligoflexales bacterium]|nr:hypothetical protein [Oligoflexales bacterium]